MDWEKTLKEKLKWEPRRSNVTVDPEGDPDTPAPWPKDIPEGNPDTPAPYPDIKI